MSTKYVALLALLSALFHNPSAIHAQGSGFTYQGHLADNGVAGNGNYDLRFTLFDAPSNGNVIGSPVSASSITVANGLFTVTLNSARLRFRARSGGWNSNGQTGRERGYFHGFDPKAAHYRHSLRSNSRYGDRADQWRADYGRHGQRNPTGARRSSSEPQRRRVRRVSSRRYRIVPDNKRHSGKRRLCADWSDNHAQDLAPEEPDRPGSVLALQPKHRLDGQRDDRVGRR